MVHALIGLDELLDTAKVKLKEMATDLSITYTKKTTGEDLAAAIYTKLQQQEAELQAQVSTEANFDTIAVTTENEVIAGLVKSASVKPETYTKSEVEGLFKTRKEQIFFLLSRNQTRADIAKILNIYYSQVHTYAKLWQEGKGQITPSTHGDVSAKIRKLHDAGWERAAIAKKLGKEYSFVHNVIKRYEQLKCEASKLKERVDADER